MVRQTPVVLCVVALPIHLGAWSMGWLQIITSAMHNIIASEQSGVECACVCVLRVVQNCIVAYLELRITLRYVQCPDRHKQPFRRLG